MHVATVILGCLLVVCVTATVPVVVKDLVLGRHCHKVYNSCPKGYDCIPVNYGDRAGKCRLQCGLWAAKEHCPEGYHCHPRRKGETGYCHKDADSESTKTTKTTRKPTTSTRPF